jgi:DNA replication protein DnaC
LEQKSAPDYSCPRCQDTGLIVREDTAFLCPCVKQKQLENLFRASKIKPAFRQKRFDNFDPDFSDDAREMFDAARAYVENFTDIKNQPENWLVFLGQPGSGKTHLLIAVANSLMEQGHPVLYFQHVEGFAEIRDAVREGGKEGTAGMIAEVKQAPVLLWDDMFKIRETPFMLEVVFEIANYRYLNFLPTLFSSEKSPRELLEVDEAIASRILERARNRIFVNERIDLNYRLSWISL